MAGTSTGCEFLIIAFLVQIRIDVYQRKVGAIGSRLSNPFALVGSLKAPSDAALPIRFWQLYSVLGSDKIESIVKDFYSMVRTPYRNV